MNHRLVWEKAHGPIPEGYEVNHMCGNRACCNLEHLELLDRNTHLVMTNEERYVSRKAEAKIYWLKTGCTGTHLGEQFGLVSRQPVGGYENGRCRDYLLARVGRWGEIPHLLEAQGTVDHIPL